MRKNMIKWIGCLALLISSGFAAKAQNPVTPASVDRLKMESLWIRHTNNVAGAILENPWHYALTDFEYQIEKGEFKRVQSGNDNNSFRFNTEGGGVYDALGGGYAWGEFHYDRSVLRGAKYNASLADPLRGMPFIIADPNPSKWINQNYSMQVKLATPLIWNQLILGVGATYENGIAAKQVDPRPKVLLSELSVNPSVIWTKGKHAIGADFVYLSHREDGSASNTNYRVPQMGWEILYPGYFMEGEISSFGSITGLRNFNANGLGGGLQYGYKAQQFRIVAGGEFRQTTEDVTNSYTTPKRIGTTNKKEWTGMAGAQFLFNDGNSLFADYTYYNRSIDGIEYIQIYNSEYESQEWIVYGKYIKSNYSTVNHNVGLQFMIAENDRRDFSWQFGVNATTEKLSDIYYLPESTQEIHNVLMKAYVKKNFVFGKRSNLLLTLEGFLNKNTDAEHKYGGYYEGNMAYTQFALVDFYYLSSSYNGFTLDANYTVTNIDRKNTMSLYVAASFNYVNPTSYKDYFDKRSTLVMKIGLAF
ncbi:MAG: hypothetical protein GX281_01720 [Bacteroidales bacterium]|jgi:hypothetical protein|nr:hypothetical protein [Bacteroidales bacterium]NLK79430.1 hypothetical protein [Bacteroidales bacterium]HKM31184.1 hypothetical protein [Bacteroidales bacterium]